MLLPGGNRRKNREIRASPHQRNRACHASGRGGAEVCAEQRKDGRRQRARRHGQHVQRLPPDRASTGMPECSPYCRLQMSRGRFVLILYLYLHLFNPSVTQHPASSTLPRFSLAHSLPFDGTEEESHVILILRLRVPLQWPEPGLLSQKPTPRLKSEIPKAREEATLGLFWPQG